MYSAIIVAPWGCRMELTMIAWIAWMQLCGATEENDFKIRDWTQLNITTNNMP